MFKLNNRITIFTGNLGSGKTEISVNYALALKEKGHRAVLVDLDIVNPYFRTRLVEKVLAGRGLEVICPRGQLASADLPALSPAIKGVFEAGEIHGVFDVGGDDVGATPLGIFAGLMPGGSYNLLFVVNACRPFTRDVKGVLKILAGVEKASGMKVTGLVSNTNIGRETDIDTIMAGHRVVQEAAKTRGLPVAFAAAGKELAPGLAQRLGEETGVLPLEFFMRTPWQMEGDLNDPSLKIPQAKKDIDYFK